MIAQGRISVNGKIIREQGVRIDPQNDVVCVDGDRISLSTPVAHVYLMLNKPRGVHTTVSDPHAPVTVMSLVEQVGTRVYPVGRLDADTAGLLLLTNDGDFAYRLTHPRFHVPRTYRVRAAGFVGRGVAERLAGSVMLDDGPTMPAGLKYLDYDEATRSTLLEITLTEGRNRQIRRMMQAVSHPVRDLVRISYGNLTLGSLAPGTWRKLRPQEVEELKNLAGEPKPLPPRRGKHSQ